jgi:hypothetical protein
MTSNKMSSRGGKPRLRQCPASTKDKPQSGRSPGSRVMAFAPPSQFHGHPFFQWHLEQKLAGYSCGNSAGFPPASLLSTLSRRPGASDGVRRVLDGGQGGGQKRFISCRLSSLGLPTYDYRNMLLQTLMNLHQREGSRALQKSVDHIKRKARNNKPRSPKCRGWRY